MTVSEVIDNFEPVDQIDVPRYHHLGRHRARSVGLAG